MKIKKIPLEDLLNLLEYLYEIGVDYIDVYGENNNEQDNIFISFVKDYVSEEFKENFPEDSSTDIELNSDNLNDLT